jgi:hypothetical protein
MMGVFLWAIPIMINNNQREVLGATMLRIVVFRFLSFVALCCHWGRHFISRIRRRTMTIHNYIEAIEQRCVKDEDTGCWNWTRATHVQGYAFMRHRGAMKTVQRIMALELELFPNIDFYTRVTTSCDNKLCCNPDHIIALTHTECNHKRYAKHGTGGKMAGKERELRDEYNHMKANEIPRTINILAHKYNCHPTVLYRAIHKANDMDEIGDDLRGRPPGRDDG